MVCPSKTPLSDDIGVLTIQHSRNRPARMGEAASLQTHTVSWQLSQAEENCPSKITKLSGHLLK